MQKEETPYGVPSFLPCGLFLQQHQNHAVDHAGKRAEHDDGSCHREHLGGHAGDEALWLCQVRHTLFSEKLRQPTFQWAAFASGYCLD